MSRSWLDLSPPRSATKNQRYDYGEPVFSAIHAVARAAMNAKLDNFAANRLAVAPMPQRQAGQPCQNLPLPDFVPQSSQPCVEIGFAEDLEHRQVVIYGLQNGKRQQKGSGFAITHLLNIDVGNCGQISI